jgi:lipopolysaccharide biosynthesis glycosyltransferase
MTGNEMQCAGKTGNRVHLLLCVDPVFVQHAAVCLTSVLMNNQDLFFDIVVAGRLIEASDEEKLRRSIARFSNHTFHLHRFIPPPEILLPLEPGAHQTVDTYTRFWVADFFPADVDRVLYLDGDVVVVNSLKALWNVELGGALLAAVDVPDSERVMARFGIPPDDGYFNAGVLLIDLAQWRQTRALDAALDYVKINAHLVRHDQDALNACFHDRRRRLDYKWNAMWPFFYAPRDYGPLSPMAVDEVRRHIHIIHFNGVSKPWNYFCDHPCRGEYDKYLRMTEWRDFVPADRTFRNRLRMLSRHSRSGISAALSGDLKRFLKAVVARQ